MTPDARFQVVCRHFDAARQLPDDAARRAYLDDACANDSTLRAEVEAMLASHHASDAPEAEPAVSGAANALGQLWEDAQAPPVIPTQVGKYRIRKLLGSGGVGTVYEAEQQGPRRRVALKFLKHEFASEAVHSRFKQEAEALAALQHPGICQIYEMGTAQTSLGACPFLALELIDGIPLNEYAERKSLNLDDRLRLVADLADIVAHAHTRGVIHRDLKPSNILVMEGAKPKVLDFGLARWADGRTQAGQTHTGHVVGTLAYMSPEQASGIPDAVDTRSDVYALGAMLYELVTGEIPHAVDKLPVYEALAVINQIEVKPARTVRKSVPTDVSVILQAALHRDKEKRYQSASALAEDIRRYLADEPITARPPTAGYHFVKFVKRHKALVASITVALMALTVGLVLALLFARDAKRSAEATARAGARANMSAAVGELQNGNGTGARLLLRRVDAPHRDWIWDYLSSQVDTSIARHPLPEGISSPMSAEAAELWTDDGWRMRLRTVMPHELAPTADARNVVGFVDTRTNAPLRVNGKIVAGRWLLASGGATTVVVGEHLTLDGTRVSSDVRRDVLVIERTSGRMLAQHKIDEAVVVSASSEDGKHLVMASASSRVYFMDVATGAIKRLDATHSLPIACLAVTPDGSVLASGSADMSIQVLDPSGVRPNKRLVGHGGTVTALAFSHDGGLLASAAADSIIRIWDLRSGATQVLVGHESPPTLLRFSADGTRLRSISTGAYREWLVDHERLDVLRVHKSAADGNSYPYVYCVAQDQGGRYIVSGGWDDTVRVVDAKTLSLVRTLSSKRVHEVNFLSDGTLVATGHETTRWDVDTGAQLARSDLTVLCESATPSPDGKTLLAVGTAFKISSLDPKTLTSTPWTEDETLLSCRHVDVAWRPDGTQVTLATSGTAAFLCDPATRTPIHKISRPQGRLFAVTYDPSGRTLATSGHGSGIQIWDSESGVLQRELRGHFGRVYALAYSPDGRLLASGARDHTIRIWDVEAGETALVLRGHTDYVHDLAWSADGKTLLSASGDNSVRVWTSRTNRERWRTMQHELQRVSKPR